ncbi:SurA N-terminal domain-containing protein [Jeotgalibacillus sp. JSM ZJ347]|uniref:SurA N-terminal domain-containing protein n=1 Tax=Jeotgalibacillus sp. JSM ZJ347 TaxID=3342117 RepID=UPI0035A9131B
MNFKKIFLPFAAGALALGLAACSDEESANTEAENEEPTAEEQQAAEDQQAAAEEMQAAMEEQQVAEDEVVATINGEEITGEAYNSALASTQSNLQQMGQDPTTEEGAEQAKTQTLDLLVNQTLIIQKANEAGLEASEEEIDEEYAAFQERFGGEEAMTELMEAQGLDVETLRGQMADSIKFDKYISEVAPVEEPTDEEIQTFYDENVVTQAEAAGQEAPALEDVRENIVSSLTRPEQQEKLMAHLEELKADAEIERLI